MPTEIHDIHEMEQLDQKSCFSLLDREHSTVLQQKARYAHGLQHVSSKGDVLADNVLVVNFNLLKDGEYYMLPQPW
jgi:hypothetical protein